jgi:xanthine dehydrogenase accessory factor
VVGKHQLSGSAAMTSTQTDQTSRDIGRIAETWLARDGKVAIATIIDTWGSAPVPVGGQMAIAADGSFEGSVSGGCVEGEVITEASEILESGTAKTLIYGVEDETAWRVGLPCGGRIQVQVERLTGASDAAYLAKTREARDKRQALVIESALDGSARRIHERHDSGLEPSLAQRFLSGKSGIEESPKGRMFVHALLPPPRILIIGATHMAQILAELVRLNGYEGIVIDPRTAFAAERRFPGVKLITEWPQDALPTLGLDPYAAIASLAHVNHIDDEALKLAVKSECFYIGALGSKRNHAKRTERLTAAGITADEIARIKCPIGLDIGASTPPEIATSVMAEIIRHLRGAKGKGASAA